MPSLTHKFSDQKLLFRRVYKRRFFVLILWNRISKVKWYWPKWNRHLYSILLTARRKGGSCGSKLGSTLLSFRKFQRKERHTLSRKGSFSFHHRAERLGNFWRISVHRERRFKQGRHDNRQVWRILHRWRKRDVQALQIQPTQSRSWWKLRCLPDRPQKHDRHM